MKQLIFTYVYIALLYIVSLFCVSYIVSCSNTPAPTSPRPVHDTVYVQAPFDSSRAVITLFDNEAVVRYGDQVWIADTILDYASDRVMVQWSCSCDFEPTIFIGVEDCQGGTATCSQLAFK